MMLVFIMEIFYVCLAKYYCMLVLPMLLLLLFFFMRKYFITICQPLIKFQHFYFDPPYLLENAEIN